MRWLWRISNHCDLQGLGGERSDGRWHTAKRSKRIVYLSEHPALALIEVLANLKGDPTLLPAAYQLMKIAAPEQITAVALDLNRLSGDWRDDQIQTRSIGDTWLASSQSGLLAVPSVPSPESMNYLLNPLHQDAKGISIEWCRWVKYDQRLFHLSRTEE